MTSAAYWRALGIFSLLPVVLLVTPLLALADIRTESVETTEPMRRHRLSLELGAGAQLGLIGAGWTFAPYEHFRLEAGAGLGASSTQLSLMPQVAFGSTSNRFVAGAGMALGLFDLHCRPVCLWLNVDAVGYEHLYSNGFSLFVGAGITMPFQQTGLQFWGPPIGAFTPLPQIRFGLGWWLGHTR